jgi:hypothetical protein
MTGDLQWRRSSLSGSTGGQCVEVADPGDGRIYVRDSKNPTGPRLVVAVDAWRAFLMGVHDGEFEPPAGAQTRP